jgi:hypothetical protein
MLRASLVLFPARGLVGFAALLNALFSPLYSQTTQGIIVGSIADSVTGLPVPSAAIVCLRSDTGARQAATSGSHGEYSVAGLSPANYIVTVSAQGYQTQQARAVDLPVSGRIDLKFRLRPLNDLWEAGRFQGWITPQSQQSVQFYGPDVDTSRIAVFSSNTGSIGPLDNSLSDVITQDDIQSLPLTGRDVYTMLMLLPGVTSDLGTARGLGFSVNGQRPSSSNYLLDGVENNNLLVTGPLADAVPEFLQEYRISTSNYSAEYGRTSGFVANAITRTGANAWHTDLFLYWNSQWLAANGFQENASGIPRAPLHEWEPGLFVSGPAVRRRLFVSGGFESRRHQSQYDPQTFVLPTQSFVDSLSPSSFAGQYLRQYLPASRPDGPGDYGFVTLALPTTVSRFSEMLRLDDTFDRGTEHFFARLWLDQLNLPNFSFDPYPQFSSNLQQKSVSAAAGLVSQISPSLLNEFRVSRTGDSESLFTFQPAGVPELSVNTVQAGDQSYSIMLPTSNNAYNYWNRGANWELLDNVTWVTGRHVVKSGFGWLQREPELQLSAYPLLEYDCLADFSAGKPSELVAETDRLSPVLGPVAPDRAYRYRQFNAFLQDSFHLTSRLMFDYGIRYEYYGVPQNIGSQKDLLIELGPGSGIQSGLAGASYSIPAGGDQPLFQSRTSNWAPRTGFAWDVTGRGSTLLRASYGIFYDAPFDNLWENVIQNQYQTSTVTFTQPQAVPAPLSGLLAAGTLQNSSNLVNGLLFQPGLRAPLIQSGFLGLQQTLSRGLTLEVNALASRGRGLITTDDVNRGDSVFPTSENPFGRLQPALGDLDYRANQGSSQYTALATTLRFRRSSISGQVSYTWSHSIDNQSDPLENTFFSFNQLAAAGQSAPAFSAFASQFDSNGDRGNSDFDQRQNLVFFASYRFPSVLRGWTAAGLGALRSGLPFTVYSGAVLNQPLGSETIINTRADLISPAQAYTSQPYSGGRLLLNAAAFQSAQPNSVGTSGRNAFYGPGLVNFDASLARTFHVRAWKETFSMTLRADAYNVLNHANLGNPYAHLGAPGFGVAQYGLSEAASGFPLLQPLSEAARQVQLMLQIHI